MKQTEKDVFFLITTDCNLHCFACGYGCQKGENPWYITKEDFKNTLLKLKQSNIDNCKKFSINITGGDPLLHPDWLEFALLTREILPDSICFVSTNGLLMHTLSDETLLFCYNKGIKFGISLYPQVKLLNMYLQIKKRFEDLKIIDSLTWNFSRIIFGKPTLNIDNDINQCYEDMFNNCDYIYIYQNNIYNCQTAFVRDRYFGFTQPKYFTVKDIYAHQNLKNIETQSYCKNCNLLFDEMVLWHQANKLNRDCKFDSLKDLYLNDYENYYILKHDCKEHLECLNNDFFKSYFTPYVNKHFYQVVENRFFTGIADLYIPFNQSITSEFKNLLLNQSIIKKCNLYFVSLTENKNIQSQVYDLFYLKDNEYFLKADKNGFLTFLKNSYRNNKYALDITNYSELKDSQFLESIFKI